MSGNNILAGDSDKCKRRLEVMETPEWADGKIWTTVTITKGALIQPDSYLAFEWKPEQLLLERFRGTRDMRWLPEFQRFGRIYCMPAPVSLLFFQKN
jgi:hypothetical protein